MDLTMENRQYLEDLEAATGHKDQLNRIITAHRKMTPEVRDHIQWMLSGKQAMKEIQLHSESKQSVKRQVQDDLQSIEALSAVLEDASVRELEKAKKSMGLRIR